MGIKDLLRFLKPFVELIHIKKYSGKRVGIDAYSWLHKGAYSCSMELCLNSQGEDAKRYLRYFMHHIDLLRHYEVTPVVVFDGRNIPCKSATEQDRQRKKDTNLALAKEKLKEGKDAAAIEFFRKAVCITPTMAHQLIQILRLENIEYVVAPYEADAQLAYLATLESDRGGIAAVITEDSDLMAYGCQAVIFKMDRYGNGEEILLEKVLNCVSHAHSFKYFDKELFTGMCVLAGCDFLPSIPGIGIKRAYSFVSKYRNLDRVLSVLKFDRVRQMPEDYFESFQKAVAVFHHARIYDAESKTLKMMKPLSEKLLQSLDGDLDILGPELPPSIAAAIAEGYLNPITMEAFDHFSKTDDLNPVTIPAFSFCSKDIKSTQESCLTLFPPSESREEKTTRMVADQTPFNGTKYLNEALALGKLLEPVNYRQKSEKMVELSKIPNNNPFKKRKLVDGNSFEVRRVDEQVSVMVGEERTFYKEFILPMVSEKESENMVEQNNLPDNPLMKKGGKMENGSSNESENMAEEESLVTSVGRSCDVLSSSPVSQQSVSSKPATELAIRKGRTDTNMKTQKNGKITEREKSSILKFFRHV